MVVSEKINRTVEKLPFEVQLQVLDFVEFVARKAEKINADDEEKRWEDFSLNQAMKGLEDEEMPEYTEADLKERWR